MKKKLLSFVWIVLLCIVSLCGCVAHEKTSDENLPSVDNDISLMPPPSSTYAFLSTRDYYEWFFPTEGEPRALTERHDTYPGYTSFFKGILSGEMELLFPYYGERLLSFNEAPELLGTSFMRGWDSGRSVDFAVPQLYYASDKGAKSTKEIPTIQITIAYMGLVFPGDMLKGISHQPIYDFCKNLCWSKPIHLNWSKERTERTLKLADQIVYSLWMPPQNINGMNFVSVEFFYQDDVFVRLEGIQDVLTDAFFSQFRIAPLDEKNKGFLGIPVPFELPDEPEA